VAPHLCSEDDSSKVGNNLVAFNAPLATSPGEVGLLLQVQKGRTLEIQVHSQKYHQHFVDRHIR
jgi:hypothetical protein